jgi:hypothetical protein
VHILRHLRTNFACGIFRPAARCVIAGNACKPHIRDPGWLWPTTGSCQVMAYGVDVVYLSRGRAYFL